MSASTAPTLPASVTAQRWYPLLLLLFAGSGCAALIYELVWYQMLELAIGSQTVCLGFLLAAFMGGLCLGSIGLPRYLQRQRRRGGNPHPLRVYAMLELATGALGLLVLWLMPVGEHLYFIAAADGLPGMLLRGLISALFLLPPTILMGASLPAIVSWIEATPGGVGFWGLLYGANTAGAVFGCLWAGFYLLRLTNMYTTTYVAVAINLAVGGLGLMLAARTSQASRAPAAPSDRAPAPRGSEWTVYTAIGLSGATALGAEVVWTRLFSMLMGITVYSFSIILAVFLVGLALGAGMGSRISRAMRPRVALGWSQMLLVLGIAWTGWMIAYSLPYWPIDPMLTTSPWYIFQMDLARTLWSLLPATILWGASFPLALAAVARQGDDPAECVGKVYAANTLGAIVGALAVSIVLIPAIGTQNCERLMVALALVSAVIAWLPEFGSARDRAALGAGLVAAAALAVVVARSIGAVPGTVVAYGREVATAGTSQILDVVEGRNSSIAIERWSDGAVGISVNGHVEATTEPFDMRLQRMVGFLPGLLESDPKSVLGIGFGAGVSAGTFTRFPSIQHITICEIEPVIPPTSTKYFRAANYDVMNNPKTHIVYDDARNYLLTTNQKFDVIASDPLDVFAKGTAALYSVQYFQAVKDHLNPGGYFSLYMPLYESDLATVKSELATFFAVFPHGTVWGNTVNGEGYDLVLLGQKGPLHINVDEVQARLSRPSYAKVAESLNDVGFSSALALFRTYAGQAQDMRAWLRNAPLNRDSNLRLQYMGGWGIDSSMEEQLWQQILVYRQPPTDIFRGNPTEIQTLLGYLTPGTPPE